MAIPKGVRAILACCFCATIAPAQNASATPDVLVLNKIKSNADLPGNLAFVDFATGNVLARVPVGREPHEIAVSPDGKYAAVANTGSYQSPGNTLSLIDIGTRKETRRVELGPLWNPHGVSFNDGRFYFTAEGARVLGAYDPVTDHVVWVMGTGQNTTHLLVFSRDGKTAFASNRGSASVTMLELNSDSPLKADSWRETQIPVCNGPEGLDLSPDGKELWVGCRMSNEMAVVNVAGKKVVTTFPTRTQAIARVKFTLDGRRVLGTDLARGELAIWDAVTHQEVKRPKMGTGCEGILIVPGHMSALIAVTNDDNVAEVDLETLEIRRRIQTGQGPDGMAWIGKQ